MAQPLSAMAPLWARSRSWTTVEPGARWPARADLTLAELGFPCPQTAAIGFLCTSMATRMQSFWRESPRLRAWP